jgi:hypothetical protein
VAAISFAAGGGKGDWWHEDIIFFKRRLTIRLWLGRIKSSNFAWIAKLLKSFQSTHQSKSKDQSGEVG